MFVTTSLNRLSLLALPPGEKSWFAYERADLRESRGERLTGNQVVRHGLRHGEDQLKIFAVLQGMIDRRRTLSALHCQLGGCSSDGNCRQIELGAAAAGLAQAKQIQRQAVADVNGCMNLGVFGQPQCLANARRKVELSSRDAAAKLAGNE